MIVSSAEYVRPCVLDTMTDGWRVAAVSKIATGRGGSPGDISGVGDRQGTCAGRGIGSGMGRKG